MGICGSDITKVRKNIQIKILKSPANPNLKTPVNPILKSPVNSKLLIKSRYIFSHIFSFLDENKRLNIMEKGMMKMGI